MADSQNLKDSKQESKAFVDFSSTNKAASSSSKSSEKEQVSAVNANTNVPEIKAEDSKADPKVCKKLSDTVYNIFSRCGVTLADLKLSEIKQVNAHVSYNLNWTFKCRCVDKVINSVSDDTHVLSASGLDEFTLANTKELETDNTKSKSFIEHLSNADFNSLNELAGQIVCFNRVSAIGKTRCKSCHGAKVAPCYACGGKGKIECPTCHGEGNTCPTCQGTHKVKCNICQGTGKVKCKDCNGKGDLIVEREVIYDALCQKQTAISLLLPGQKEPLHQFKVEDEKAILDGALMDQNSSGVETARGYNATFSGICPCYCVSVTIPGNSKPYTFVILKNTLKPICRPPVLDFIFYEEANLLANTLLGSFDDVDEKIKTVKALAKKAILAKTIRSIERHRMAIAKEIAVKEGVTIDSLLDPNDKKSQGRGAMIRSKLKQDCLDAVTKEFIKNAYGYVSEDFARVFAKNLISFVPMLNNLNPKSKIIWAGMTLGTWLLDIILGYMMPTVVGAFLLMLLSAVICVFTSFALTKNLSYYQAVSMLKLTTHKLKKIPNINTEAVQSARLMIGSLVVGLVSILLMNFNLF